MLNYSGWNNYYPTTGAELASLLLGNDVPGVGQISRPAVVWLDHTTTYHYASANGVNVTEAVNDGGTDWLYIMTDDVANIPAEGTRIDRSYTTEMAQVTSTATNGVFRIGTRTKKVRIIGIDFTSDSAFAINWNVINCGLGAGEGTGSIASDEDHCQDIIFDRCYIHGPTDDWTKAQHNGITFYGGTRCALIESEVSAIRTVHNGGNQGYWVLLPWLCNGITIWNNRVEGSTAWPLFTGGSAATEYEEQIRDVDVRYNHFSYDSRFDPNSEDYNEISNGGGKMAEVIEIKQCERMLVEANYFNYDPPAIYSGHPFTMIIKCASQGNETPWVKTVNLTVRWNDFRGMWGGLVTIANDLGSSVREVADWGWVTIENNLIVASKLATRTSNLPETRFGGNNVDSGWNADLHFKGHDFVVRNNTFVGCLNLDSANSYDRTSVLGVTGDTTGKGWRDITFDNNIYDQGGKGVIDENDGHQGDTALNHHCESWSWNSLAYGPLSDGATAPTGVTPVESIADVGFAQWADRNGSFKVTGQYSSFGCDYDTLQTNLTIAKTGVRF